MAEKVVVGWKPPAIEIKKGRKVVSLTPKEFDEVCHWAMGAGLLPALAAECRELSVAREPLRGRVGEDILGG